MNHKVEVFAAFLKLGVTAFGGPVAHLAHFREDFVLRRKWISEQAFSDLVGFCQFLPGPTSSQVGMAIGLIRAGYLGLIVAWIAFTMPAAIMLVIFATHVDLIQNFIGSGWIYGLKAATVSIVAHALIGMAQTLIPDKQRAVIALLATTLLLFLSNSLGQVIVIIGGGIMGIICLKRTVRPIGSAHFIKININRRTASLYIIVFVTILFTLPIFMHFNDNALIALFDKFYRSGALVFGGGHVVLPILQSEIVEAGLVDKNVFLAGYGAIQALPGPIFNISAYLGALVNTSYAAWTNALVALMAIFLPGALLIAGIFPFWIKLSRHILIKNAAAGINASVVGLLAAALYDPVFKEGVIDLITLAIAITGFMALWLRKTPAWVVAIFSGLGGALFL